MATGAMVASLARFITPLQAGMLKYGITTPARIARFFAQTAIESNLFTKVEENLNYTHPERLVAVWPTRFYLPPQSSMGRLDARLYAVSPEALANVVYANRMGNGDTASGDGWRYRGQGLIQITGKSNQVAFFKAEPDFNVITTPGVLTEGSGAAMSACWYWGTHGCNDASDKNDDVLLSSRINGGDPKNPDSIVGLKERLALTKRSMRAFGAA